jgi:hypothetical protein
MDRHALTILNQLYEYDSFLDSIESIVDMGCGTGEDIAWWASLTTRDDPPEPHNYKCYAVDFNESKLSQVPDLPNIIKINRNFNKLCLPIKVDLMFSHSSLQFSTNPLETLKIWNEQMNVDGMLVLSIPQHSGVEYNRYYSRTYSKCFYHYTPTMLIYMLAVNGFDCKDAYLRKTFNDAWIDIAVYKSDIAPMDPNETSWHDLIKTGLLHPTVVNSINTHGHLKQEDIVYPWLDRENYFIDYVSQYTEIPEEAGEPIVNGIINPDPISRESKLEQAAITIKETKLSKPIGIMRPKKRIRE